MKDKILFENKWFKVLDRDGYTFVRENKDGTVVILPVRTGPQGESEYLARTEDTPCHTPNFHLCAMTGGIDHNELPISAAVRELYEESGFIVDERDMISLGSSFANKGSDLTIHYFAVYVNGKMRVRAPGDGSKYEETAENHFVSFDTASTVPDPYFTTALFRLLRTTGS